MVWGTISKKRRVSLVFLIVIGVKINGEYYKREFFENHLLSAARTWYGEDYCCSQQDGATSHTTNIVQQ
jgi:uncharacterized membrane protein